MGIDKDFAKELERNFKILLDALASEKEKCFHSKNFFQLDSLETHIDIDKASKEEIREFQIRHGMIANGKRGVIWNPQYKKEVLNRFYLWVLRSVSNRIRILQGGIKKRIDFHKPYALVRFLEKRIRRYNKITSSPDGLLYTDEEYRKQDNDLLKNRFDAIWHINERFAHFPLEKRIKGNAIITDVDYPFISFDIDQWIDFETSYRITPLLKKLLNILEGNSNNEIEKCPFKETNGIFHEGGQDKFYTILKKSGVVSVDSSNKILKGPQFRGACNYLHPILKRANIGVLKEVNKREFIEYLNLENGYDAKIRSPEKGVIANENTTTNGSLKVKSTLLSFFPKLDLG
ncbi:hypothetical protein WIW50_02360 [Flavobacteriaceae bacterium 3-367]